MCRCSRNDLPARPISHLWTVRAGHQSGGGLRLVGSWRGDCGVCRDCVENKSTFHDFHVEAGKLTGCDSPRFVMAFTLRFPPVEFGACSGCADDLRKFLVGCHIFECCAGIEPAIVSGFPLRLGDGFPRCGNGCPVFGDVDPLGNAKD